MRLWYQISDLSAEEERVATNAARELQSYVTGASVGIDLTVACVPEPLSSQIDASLLDSQVSSLHHLLQGPWELRDSRIPPAPLSNGDMLVLCRGENSRLAQIARQTTPHAFWGSALEESGMAVVYQLKDPITFWHESFHLLGATDCYDDANPQCAPSTCGEPQCVMQYGLVADRSDLRPTLCRKNIGRLLDWSGLTRA